MRRLFFFLACVFITGCSSTKVSRNHETSENRISELIDSMTLREKIGQMIAVVPENFDFKLTQNQIDSEKTTASIKMSESMKKNFHQYPAGTLILFSKNIESPEQTKKIILDFKMQSKFPLMIAVDEEGGRVSRIAKNESFGIENICPAFETETESKAQKNSFYIASYISELGFNADFAPVADIWTNEKNTVIGNRAFSSDASKAAKLIQASISGFHKGGVLTSIKHFPGHGDTTADTHSSSASSFKTWEQLHSEEMIPFIAGIESGTDMVMISHISTPNAGTEDIPATLSKTWITDRLRGELGFQGVVITDAMGMKAITSRYGSLESALLAIEAGADIILMPHDFKEVFDGLVKMAETGKLSMESINESARRILEMKFRMK